MYLRTHGLLKFTAGARPQDSDALHSPCKVKTISVPIACDREAEARGTKELNSVPIGTGDREASGQRDQQGAQRVSCLLDQQALRWAQLWAAQLHLLPVPEPLSLQEGWVTEVVSAQGGRGVPRWSGAWARERG